MIFMTSDTHVKAGDLTLLVRQQLVTSMMHFLTLLDELYAPLEKKPPRLVKLCKSNTAQGMACKVNVQFGTEENARC